MIIYEIFFASYFLGSIPFGLLLTRLSGYGNLRAIGSGNIGATNVLRTGNKKLALLTLVLDAGKGALAVILASFFDERGELVAALGVFLGHLFPVWLRFRGGKGVATALGISAAVSWPIGAIACALWLLVALAFRYSSLAALIAIASTPITSFFVKPEMLVLFLIIAAFVIIRHHANIKRLFKGCESKIDLIRSSQP